MRFESRSVRMVVGLALLGCGEVEGPGARGEAGLALAAATADPWQPGHVLQFAVVERGEDERMRATEGVYVLARRSLGETEVLVTAHVREPGEREGAPEEVALVLYDAEGWEVEPIAGGGVARTRRPWAPDMRIGERFAAGFDDRGAPLYLTVAGLVTAETGLGPVRALRIAPGRSAGDCHLDFSPDLGPVAFRCQGLERRLAGRREVSPARALASVYDALADALEGGRPSARTGALQALALLSRLDLDAASATALLEATADDPSDPLADPAARLLEELAYGPRTSGHGSNGGGIGGALRAIGGKAVGIAAKGVVEAVRRELDKGSVEIVRPDDGVVNVQLGSALRAGYRFDYRLPGYFAGVTFAAHPGAIGYIEWELRWKVTLDGEVLEEDGVRYDRTWDVAGSSHTLSVDAWHLWGQRWRCGDPNRSALVVTAEIRGKVAAVAGIAPLPFWETISHAAPRRIELRVDQPHFIAPSEEQALLHPSDHGHWNTSAADLERFVVKREREDDVDTTATWWKDSSYAQGLSWTYRLHLDHAPVVGPHGQHHFPPFWDFEWTGDATVFGYKRDLLEDVGPLTAVHFPHRDVQQRSMPEHLTASGEVSGEVRVGDTSTGELRPWRGDLRGPAPGSCAVTWQASTCHVH